MRLFHKATTQSLDVSFSILIRRRGDCELRGKDGNQCSGQLECAHIISRTNRRLRWDVMNALCLCHSHHAYYTAHPLLWRAVIAERFPEQDEYVQRERRVLVDDTAAYHEQQRTNLDALLAATEGT